MLNSEKRFQAFVIYSAHINNYISFKQYTCYLRINQLFYSLKT